jgi:hypothetical protein
MDLDSVLYRHCHYFGRRDGIILRARTSRVWGRIMYQKEEIDRLLSDIEANLHRAKLGEPQLEMVLSAMGLDGVGMAEKSTIQLASWLNKMDTGMRAYALQRLGALMNRAARSRAARSHC